MSRDLLLILSALFTWGVGEGMFFYFQQIYLQQLGAGPLQIGIVMGGYGLAATLAHLPAGWLSDRWGRRQLMWASWLLGMTATWIMALSAGLTGFVAGLWIYGLTFGVMAPLNSYVTAARGRLSVARAVTLVSAAFNLGGVLGPLLGGLIGDRLGLRQTFYLAGTIFVVSSALILFIRPQPVEKRPAEERQQKSFLAPHLLLYMAMVFLAIFAVYLPHNHSQNFLRDVKGLSLGAIGGLISLSGLGVFVLNMLFGQLDARLGFLLSQAAAGGFALLLWQGTGLPAYAVGYFLMGGYKTARTLASAQTRALVRSTEMGLAYGLTETVASLATILAPLLAGVLYSRNPVLIYPASLGLICLSILAGLRFSPLKAKTLELAAIPVPEEIP